MAHGPGAEALWRGAAAGPSSGVRSPALRPSPELSGALGGLIPCCRGEGTPCGRRARGCWARRPPHSPYSPQHADTLTTLPATMPPRWHQQPMVPPPPPGLSAPHGGLPRAPGASRPCAWLLAPRPVGTEKGGEPRPCCPLPPVDGDGDVSGCPVEPPASAHLPPSAAITKREETSFDLWRCLLSTKGEGKKRNPFSINTLQVHSSNQAEEAVKNSSALLGLGTSCSEGAGSRQPLLQGHSGTGREQRRGAGQAVLGTGGSYVGMDRQGAPAVHGAGQGVGCPTYVGPGCSGTGPVVYGAQGPIPHVPPVGGGAGLRAWESSSVHGTRL